MTDEDLGVVLDAVVEEWVSRGLAVRTVTNERNGRSRVIGESADGYFFDVDEREGEIRFRGMSPVYWGSRVELLRATGERRRAEDAAGAPWSTTDRDENNYAYRLPGVYRPFPAWDTPLPDNSDE